MSLPPNPRNSSVLGTGFVAFAIVAALGIGWFAKHAPDEDSPPPKGGMTRAWQMNASNVERIATGKGTPKDEQGNPVSVGLPYVFLEPAVWARVDLNLPPDQVFRRPNGLSVRIRDEHGATWPKLETWHRGSVYVTLPYGYAQRPRRLHLTVQAQDLGTAQTTVLREIELPPLPAPKRATLPAATNDWPELQAFCCHTQERLNNFVFADAPLKEGEVLIARIVGGSGGLYASAPKRIKDTNPRNELNPLLSFSPFYLNTPGKIYVEVALMRTKPKRQRFRFTDLPIRREFDESWIVGESKRQAFGPGAQVSLFGRDLIPSRRPDHKRREISVYASFLGLPYGSTARLLRPKEIEGVPVRLRRSAPPAVVLWGSGFRRGDAQSPSSEGQVVESTPIEIEVVAEALTIVKRKTLVIDFDPGNTRLVRSYRGRDVSVADF